MLIREALLKQNWVNQHLTQPENLKRANLGENGFQIHFSLSSFSDERWKDKIWKCKDKAGTGFEIGSFFS